MNILIDIGHPAHVHLFKNFAKEMIRKKHKVLFTCRDKEFEIALLEHNGFDYVSFGEKYKSTLGKIWGLLKFDYKEYRVACKFKPDIFLSHGSMYAAHAAWLMNKPHIALEDTGNVEQMRLYLPFTKVVLTPNTLPYLSKNQIKYNGYHQLAYLHPSVYEKEQSGHSILGLNNNEKYCVIRFVGFNASHDAGLGGLSEAEKIELVHYLELFGRVYITSEQGMPEALKKNRISIKPEQLHDVLSDAQLLVSEGGTTASEGAMLGVPTVFICSSYGMPISSTLQQQNNDKMLLGYKTFTEAFDSIKKIVGDPEAKEEFQSHRLKIMSNMVNLTNFLVWVVEKWPQSYSIMKENPGFQDDFIDKRH